MFGDLRRFDTAPSRGLEWFRQLMDEAFPETGPADIRSVPRGSFPLINVGRTDEAVRVYVFAAGLSADELELSIQDNVLTVTGRREPDEGSAEAPQEARPRSDFRRERYRGEFSRSLALPEGVDVDRVEARCRDGVLEVVLPKREELKPRRIDVQPA